MEIKIIQKRLDYAPIQNKINGPELGEILRILLDE